MDLSQGTVKCNCSMCSKTRSWIAFVPPQQFHLLSGADSQAEYQWTPPGKDQPSIHYHFSRPAGPACRHGAMFQNSAVSSMPFRWRRLMTSTRKS